MATTVEATKGRASEPVAPTAWFRDSRRQVAGGAAVAAVIAVGVWFVITSGRRKEEFATNLLSRALATADKGNFPQASADLQRVIQTYSGTNAAGEAVLALNQIRMASGQTQLAVTNLGEFLAQKPPAQFAAPAYGLMGAAQENNKRFAEAAAAYEQAAAVAEVAFVKASYLVDAGRAYRAAGKPQDAIRVYRTVREKYPDAPAAVEAAERLGELTAGQ